MTASAENGRCFTLKMVQLDRLFQFAAGSQVSHDAWMRSMALFEAGEPRPHFFGVSVGLKISVVAKIEFGGSGFYMVLL